MTLDPINAPPWRPRTGRQLWAHAAAELGWGWIVVVLWLIPLTSATVRAQSDLGRLTGFLMIVVSVLLLLGVLGLLMHVEALKDARQAGMIEALTDKHRRG